MDYKNLIHNLYQGFLHRDPASGDVVHWEAKLKAGVEPDAIMDLFLQSDEFKSIRKRARGLFVEPGHFYSPIVNVDEVREAFDATPSSSWLPGITIGKEAQSVVWRELLPYLKDIPFPEEKKSEYRYFFLNPAFGHGDGSVLHAMLRRYRPRRLVEIGSGYSSACAIDTIDHFLDAKVEVSFIEPFPELLISLLGEETARRFKIHSSAVQKADLNIFDELEAGDFLFIDSTHVMKTGSDVCHELFNILPALKPGVFIHFHDIFWPFEYGTDWVLKENRSWNEIYGLRAFLMFNDTFEIIFFNDYFVRFCREMVEADYPAMLKNSGGSIWLRKKY